MNPFESVLDKMLWFCAPVALLAACVAAYSSYCYLSWPETNAKVMSIDYTCHSSKRGWGKGRKKIYYRCGDHIAVAEGRREGYEPGGAKELRLAIQFTTLSGETKNTSISKYEQMVRGKKAGGVYPIRYNQSNPLSAQFSDLLFSNMRDFWFLALAAGVVAFFCRRLLTKIH